MTLSELSELLDAYSFREEMNGHAMFTERPDRWFDDPHWRCVNNHVNTEVRSNGGWIDVPGIGRTFSYQLCKECGEFVRLTFPEDVPGPLVPPKAVL